MGGHFHHDRRNPLERQLHDGEQLFLPFRLIALLHRKTYFVETGIAQSVEQSGIQQVARRVQTRMDAREQISGAFEVCACFVRIEHGLAAGQGQAHGRAAFARQTFQLFAPRKLVLAIVGEILFVRIEAEEAITMTVVGNSERAAYARTGARNASTAQKADRHAGPAVANPRACLLKARTQILRFGALFIAQSELHACRFNRTNVVVLDGTVQAERLVQCRILTKRQALPC